MAEGTASSTTGSLLLFLALCLATTSLQQAAEARHQRGIYIFGDSTADVGNNNYLPHSKAKADHPYNGIDFPGGKATGRFSNGFNTADELAKLMGLFKSPPPFLSLSQKRLRLYRVLSTGINFASGGSGIFDRTGQELHVVPMGVQVLEHFASVRRNLTLLLGSEQAAGRFLSKSLFLISAGSNDLFEYSFSNYSLDRTHDRELVTLLTFNYEYHLRALYEFGARRFGIISVSMLGCCPSQRARTGNGTCYQQLNDLAQMFYAEIGDVLRGLAANLPGFRYSLANGYEMAANIIEGRTPSPFTDLKYACCGGGPFNGGMECNQTATHCSNRNDFLFWDWYHPTQAASTLAAGVLFAGNSTLVAPVNFQQLGED